MELRTFEELQKEFDEHSVEFCGIERGCYRFGELENQSLLSWLYETWTIRELSNFCITHEVILKEPSFPREKFIVATLDALEELDKFLEIYVRREVRSLSERDKFSAPKKKKSFGEMTVALARKIIPERIEQCRRVKSITQGQSSKDAQIQDLKYKLDKKNRDLEKAFGIIDDLREQLSRR